MLSLDSVYKNSVRKGPLLLKLDTHGYEIPIFEGANSVLADAMAVIVEVYGFYVSPTARLFHDVSDYLSNRGVRLFDIVDVMRREKDGAFWQADAVFVREDQGLFADNSYK